MKTFQIKTKIYVGIDSLNRLAKIKDKTILIVCDGILVENGSLVQIKGQLDASNKVEVFSNVVADPPLETVIEGVACVTRINPDYIIGFGGGSAIDTAKGILYFAKEAGYTSIKRFIAIPTTSGTGSEVTSVTVITDSKNMVKYPIFDEAITPDEAILNPLLTLSVPQNVTANTGVDVLTHGIEAYVAKNATMCSDALAEKSIQLVMEYLPKCYDDLQNVHYREIMHQASTMAGMAFNLAGLGLNHAIAHQVGAKFHIPHGAVNGMLLPHVIGFNSKDPSVCVKYAYLARILGVANMDCQDIQAVNRLKRACTHMLKQLKIKTSLTDCGIKEDEVMKNIGDISQGALRDNCLATNPISATKEDVIQIVKRLI